MLYTIGASIHKEIVSNISGIMELVNGEKCIVKYNITMHRNTFRVTYTKKEKVHSQCFTTSVL